MEQLVLTDRFDSIGVLTLNRVSRHNSLVPDLLREMLAGLESFAQDPGVRAVLLNANGRTFSTGGDLLGFYDHLDDITEYAREVVGLLNEVVLAMIALPVPIVAAVHGLVTGGSLGLVLASDIVLIAPEASFTPYYSVVGFSPDGGWTAVLPGLIGSKRAAGILMENSTITAEQAAAWGIATRLVPGEEIQAEAKRTAQAVAGMQPGSIRNTKRLLAAQREALASRLEAERTRFAAQIGTRETQAQMTAFLQKMRRS